MARTISGDDGSRAMCPTSSSDLRVRANIHRGLAAVGWFWAGYSSGDSRLTSGWRRRRTGGTPSLRAAPQIHTAPSPSSPTPWRTQPQPRGGWRRRERALWRALSCSAVRLVQVSVGILFARLWFLLVICTHGDMLLAGLRLRRRRRSPEATARGQGDGEVGAGKVNAK